MGVDVHLLLLDRGAFARLAGVHRSWAGDRDTEAVVAALREAAGRVRALAPRGTTRAQAMDDVGRRLDALPESPADVAARAQFERTLQQLSDRAHAALRSGDPTESARVTEEAGRAFFGALVAPLQAGDARGALLRELVAINEDSPGPPLELADELDEALAGLQGGSAPPGRRGAAIPWRALFDACVVAWEREPRADVLVDLHLPFEQATTLEDLVTGARGEILSLEEPMAQLFTDEQVAAFRCELCAIPDPAPRSPERVARVRRLVELAAADPRLALGSWAS